MINFIELTKYNDKKIFVNINNIAYIESEYVSNPLECSRLYLLNNTEIVVNESRIKIQTIINNYNK